MTRAPERWQLTHDGHEHVVEIADAGLRRSVTWLMDGAEVAGRTTSDERVVLDGEPGAVGLRLPALTGPARRVTWYPPGGEFGAAAAAQAGLGGIDLDPEPGSRAAAREAWMRAHPHPHPPRRTALAVAGILLPLLALWLLHRIDVPWPDISIPWPDWDLPSIPWPDLDVPWPDWQLPDLPDWLRELLEKAKYVGPVLLAYVLARAEVRRRRAQDERKQRDGGGRP